MRNNLCALSSSCSATDIDTYDQMCIMGSTELTFNGDCLTGTIENSDNTKCLTECEEGMFLISTAST